MCLLMSDFLAWTWVDKLCFAQLPLCAMFLLFRHVRRISPTITCNSLAIPCTHHLSLWPHRKHTWVIDAGYIGYRGFGGVSDIPRSPQLHLRQATRNMWEDLDDNNNSADESTILTPSATLPGTLPASK